MIPLFPLTKLIPRSSSDIDACIESLLAKDLDEIVATYSESRSIISQSIDSKPYHSSLLDPTTPNKRSLIAMYGYCYVTRPKFLRSSKQITTKSSYYSVTEGFTALQIKDIVTMNKLFSEFQSNEN